MNKSDKAEEHNSHLFFPHSFLFQPMNLNSTSQLQAQYQREHPKCLEILNTLVKFPFRPYPTQIQYMREVIWTLQNSKNALLQSPTGTGKTLSLLCAILSWNKHPNLHRPCTVFYTTRTHAQISQVVSELKKTSFLPKIALLASKEHSCANEDVKENERGLDVKTMCRHVLAKNKCSYFRGTPLQEQAFQDYTQIMDIQDLGKEGADHNFCPHFLGKRRLLGANLVLMPYNYLVDPILRRNLEVELKDSIVVIDEGHNISTAAEEAMSFEFSVTDIFKALNSVKDLGDLIKADKEQAKAQEEKIGSSQTERKRELKASVHQANWVKNTLRALVIYIKQLNLDENRRNIDFSSKFSQKSYEGEQVFNLLEKGTEN